MKILIKLSIVSLHVATLTCAKEELPVKWLTETEIDAKYRTCPSGYYSGPQPGKARYAHNPFMWVVTPEFAKRLCLPDAFISTELKGAEAVAFSRFEQRRWRRLWFRRQPQQLRR